MDLLDWGQEEDLPDFEEFEREYHRNFETLLNETSQQYADPPSNFNFTEFNNFANARRAAESDAMQLDQNSMFYSNPQQQVAYQPYNPYGRNVRPVIKEEPRPNVYHTNVYKEIIPPSSKVQKKKSIKAARNSSS